MSDPYSIAGRRSPYNYFELELLSKAGNEKLPAINETTIAPVKLDGPRSTDPSPWKIVRFFVFIWNLIKTLFGKPTIPHLSEQDGSVYAHLLLGGTKTTLPDAKTSAVFTHIHDFLAKGKEVPAALLAEIKQTAEWIAVMESIQEPPQPGVPFVSPQERLGQLSKTITDRIKTLRNGESCVIPGGVQGHFALYRVTLKAEGYEFQVFSCDPKLQHGEVVSVAGKEKIRIGTTFTGLKLEELADPHWMHAMLNLQMPWSGSSGGELANLLDRFKDRKIDPASPLNLGLHKSRKTNTAIGTLWNFLQDAAGLAGGHRRKLRMQVNALFRYAEAFREQPRNSRTAREHLTEAMKRLHQKMLVMVKKGELTKEEHEWLTHEFGAIERLVKTSDEMLPVMSGDIQFNRVTDIPAAENFVTKPLAYALDHAVALQPAAKEKYETRSDATPFSAKATVYDRTVVTLPPFDRGNLLRSLEMTVKEMSANTDPLLLQHKLTEICLALPFQPGEKLPEGNSSGGERQLQWKQRDDDVWTALSEKDRITASQMLVSIAETIAAKSKETKSLLPDRLMALCKVSCIVLHLATLNTATTKVLLNHATGLQYPFENLVHGHNGCRTMFRMRRKEEIAVVKQLEDYFEMRTDWRYTYKIAEDQHDYFRNLKDGKLPDCEQSRHLVAMGRLIKGTYVTEPGEIRDAADLIFVHKTANRINEWGRPIQNPMFAAGVYSMAVAEGLDHDPREGYMSMSGNPWYTQEAIVDDPIRILKQSMKEWVKDHPEDHPIKKAKLKTKPIIELETFELRDLLLTMDRRTAIWNLLGLIEEHPSMLLNTDVCSMVEILFLDYKTLKNAFEADAKLKPFMGEFFDKHIKGYCNKKQLGPALFLIHLGHGLRAHQNVREIGDYTRTVYQWLLNSFQPESAVASYRYALLTEYLFLFQAKRTVTHEELRDLMVFNFYLENSVGDPSYYDPVQKDQVRQMVRLWMQPMEQAFRSNPELLQHTMDRICQLQGNALPKERWAGTFPVYRAGPLQIHLLNGTLQKVVEGEGLTLLPAEVLRNEIVKKAFPDLLKTQPKLTKLETKEGVIYGFKDAHGSEVRIEHRMTGVFCYRKHPERNTWLQAVALDESTMSALPKHMSSQQFYIAIDTYNNGDTQEFWSYGPDGKPHYRYQFRMFYNHEIRDYDNAYFFKIVNADDLRPGHAERRGMEPARLDLSLQPQLARLMAFDSSDNVTLWTKEGQLQQVEFARYGMSFKYDQNKLTCMDGPFKDYLLHLNPAHSQTGGLMAGILLEHPSKPPQFLLPRFSGGFSKQSLAPVVPPQENCLSVIKMLWNGERREEHLPNFVWVHDSDNPAGFWTFDTKDGLKPARGQKEGDLWFDALCYSISTTQRASCNPLPLAKRALHEIGRMAPGTFTDPEIMEMEKTLSRLALAPIVPYADAIALSLQGLLLLSKLGSTRVKPHLETKIATMAMAYFSCGKHIDTQSSLTQDQVTTCMHILRKQKPEYYSQNAAMLLAKEQAVTTDVVGTHQKFFSSKAVTPTALLKSKEFVIGLIKHKAEGATDLFLSPDRKALSEGFAQLYKAAQQGPKSAAADFSKMRYTLKSLPTESNGTDYTALTDFMELIFDLRAENPDFVLPDLPHLEYPVAKDKFPSFDEKEAIDKTHKESDKKAFEFFTDLVQKTAKVHAATKAKVESEFAIKQKAAKARDTSHLLHDAPHQLSEIADLEKMLASKPVKVGAGSIFAPQADDCLFTEKEILQFFVDAPQSNVEQTLALDRMADHPEPVVGVFKENLQKEMSAYKQAIATKQVKSRQIKDAPSLDSLCKMVAAKAETCAKNLDGKKEAILAMVKAPNTPVAASEQQAGYRTDVTWDELRTAYAEGTLTQLLQQAGLYDVSVAALTAQLTGYLKIETQRKYAVFCKNKIEEMIKDKTSNSASSGEKMIEMLTRCRTYDLAKYPQILFVEDTLGFFISSEQMQIISAFIQNPSSVQRALTGMGKTSVILLLAGLMMPNGSNLVTLKFLDALYPENVASIQKMLSGVLKKRVTPLLYSMKTSLIFKFRKGDKVETESTFKRMYRDTLSTILEGGCLVTDRRSQPLLEAKWNSLVYRISNLPAGTEPDPMDKEHVMWLSKLLNLFHTRQFSVFDEHDKSLHPKEEIHLRLGQPDPVPNFVWETNLKIYDELIALPKLGLMSNTQGELSEETREKLLDEAATALAKKWTEKHSQIDTAALARYFQGISDEVLAKDLAGICTDEERDEIVLTKDMLQVYLPLTVSKTGNKKYIRSADGRSIIPCDYTDVAREGSEFEEIRERIPYFIQYYYQNGVSMAFFKDWVQRLTNDAFEQMDKMRADNIEHTPANQLFKSYFPNRSLASLLQDDVKILHLEVKKNPKLIRKFLETLLPQLKVSHRKIAMDAQNQVSMSLTSAGTSATLGCVDGLHRQFKFVDDSHKHLRARMLARFVNRLKNPALLTYDPAQPKRTIPMLLAADKTLRVMIDGAGSLWSVQPHKAAKQWKASTELDAVGFFAKTGRLQIEGNQYAEPDQRGQVFSHAQSRGANVVLSAALPAALTANGRNPLEEVIQNEGRLRQEDQSLRVAVPMGSGITSVGELTGRSLAAEALDYSDNVYRSKKQEQRDIIRKEMIQNLITEFANGRFASGAALFNKYSKANFLVTEGGENWSQPGRYYALHRALEPKTANPQTALEARQKHLVQLATELGLDHAAKTLGQVKYDSPALVTKMPVGVYAHEGLVMDREVEVETEGEVEAETELSAETETEMDTVANTQDEMPYYLGWISPGGPKYKIHAHKDVLHPAYDDNLTFTENFLPLHRNTYAARVYRRSPHDLRQNRLHYIHLKSETVQVNDTWNHVIKAKVGDLYDMRDRVFPRYKWKSAYPTQQDYNVIYDTHLHREFSVEPEVRIATLSKEEHQKKIMLIVQARFEDGQYDDYTNEEWESLEKWIGSQKQPEELENYFLKEVLKSRPLDRERYQFSPLRKLFASIIARRG